VKYWLKPSKILKLQRIWKRLSVFVVTLLLVLAIGIGQPVMPSDPTPEQAAFIEEIREYAEFDAGRSGDPDEAAIADTNEQDVSMAKSNLRRDRAPVVTSDR
jgi:hypothetical protein